MDFTTFYNTIDGEARTTTASRHAMNPVNGSANSLVPVSTLADVDAAIDAAKAAFPAWAATPWEARRSAIYNFSNGLEAALDEFAKLLHQEQGKPLNAAHRELRSGLRWLRGIADLDLPDEIVREDDAVKVTLSYKPLGVAVGIVPWNFPVMLACGKIASSLITGNTFILKPSPCTPYCGLKLAELAQKFFPKGVFQALSGDDALGPWLTAHPGINKISFTGSTATGKKVMESASRYLTRVTLELGGNDAAIVCTDVDVDATAKAIAVLAFANSGQICVAIKRVYVHESICSKFVKALTEYTESLEVGTADDAFMGPVQNQAQYAQVIGLIDNVKAAGFVVTTKDTTSASQGFFIKPVIVNRPPDASRIVQEEPFGPVLPVLSWSHEDDVVKRVNQSDMGLGASVWSTDIALAESIANRLEAGTIWINSHAALDPAVPLAGHKSSGLGCEWGKEGLKGFCNVQVRHRRQQ